MATVTVTVAVETAAIAGAVIHAATWNVGIVIAETAVSVQVSRVVGHIPIETFDI